MKNILIRLFIVIFIAVLGIIGSLCLLFITGHIASLFINILPYTYNSNIELIGCKVLYGMSYFPIIVIVLLFLYLVVEWIITGD